MLEVNLSRIHAMITACRSEEAALKERLEADATSFTFTVFEKSTDADLDAFLANVEKRKAGMFQLMTKIEQRIAYRAYLKETLEEANRAHGIAKKLLQAAFLERRLSFLKDMAERMGRVCSDDMTGLQKVGYYKSAFTDDMKTYALQVRVFSRRDAERARSEAAAVRAEGLALQDEIAALNQSVTVRVLDFEEFAARNSVAP